MHTVKIAVIGGTGLDNPSFFQERQEKFVDTPFGKPSDALISGKVSGVECILLARHGRRHTVSPTYVNYRANLYALYKEGCTHVIATTACGSLKEEIPPSTFVILDQFIDRTTKRVGTFYDGSCDEFPDVYHISMADPFCEKTREIIYSVACELGLSVRPKGCAVTIEGPRFSTKAESHLFRSYGADVVNMTTFPESVLARELGMCYASIALPTDYDCWRETGEAVSADMVIKTMQQNASKATSLLQGVIPRVASADWEDTLQDLKKMLAQGASTYK